MAPECVCMALRNVLGEHAYNFVVACPTINIILATPLSGTPPNYGHGVWGPYFKEFPHYQVVRFSGV